MRMSKYFKMVVCALMVVLLLASCTSEEAVSEVSSTASTASTASEAQSTASTAESTEATNTEEGELIMVEITMEDGGVIKLELDEQAAPITVKNFVDLVEDEYYDGLTFHRIIDGFMIQGGCPLGTGTGGPGHEIKGEFASNGWENPISHTRGVISMARSSAPDSAGSQFFITNGDATFLDGDYAAFGRVVEGMEVVDAIAVQEAKMGNDGSLSSPLEPIVMKTVRVVEA